MVVNSEPSDFNKPPGQDIHGKAPEELHAIHGYRLFNGPVAVIFGNESYFPIVHVQDTIISNGHPVRVLPQVFDHMVGICQRRFAVYHPFGLIGLLNLIIEQGKLVFFAQRAFEAVEELSFKSFAQLMYRIEILTRMPNVFPSSIQRIAGSRNKAMHVRVQREVLSPGVQHSHRPGFCSKMRVSERAERVPDRSKEQVVIQPLVVQANGIQLVRHRKDDVVMLHGQGAMHQVVDPESLFGRLTFGTMPVAAKSSLSS